MNIFGGILDIAMLGIGVATLTMLVKNSRQSVQLVQGATGAYTQVLQTLIGDGGNPYGAPGYGGFQR